MRELAVCRRLESTSRDPVRPVSPPLESIQLAETPLLIPCYCLFSRPLFAPPFTSGDLAPLVPAVSSPRTTTTTSHVPTTRPNWHYSTGVKRPFRGRPRSSPASSCQAVPPSGRQSQRENRVPTYDKAYIRHNCRGHNEGGGVIVDRVITKKTFETYAGCCI